ncbi:S41 family peptidase [Cupriavidus basilensis]
MADILGQIKREYVEPVDDKKLPTEAIKWHGHASLDPHPACLDEKDFKELQEGTIVGRLRGPEHRDFAGRRPGQGHQPDRGHARAFRAGIQPGDLITRCRIDEVAVRWARQAAEQAVKRTRGAPGTKVTPTIYRKSLRNGPSRFPSPAPKSASSRSRPRCWTTTPSAGVRLTSFQERTVADSGPQAERDGPEELRV